METQLYLDLLKKSLLGELAWENEARILYLRACAQGLDTYDRDTELHLAERRPEFCRQFQELQRIGRFLDDRVENLGFQPTMIGRLRLENLEQCLAAVLHDGIAGDVMECGIWQGGAVLFLRGYLKAHGITDRLVWAADSFAGVPPSRLPQDAGEDLCAATHPNLAVPLHRVQALFERYGLLDDRVRFLEGLFRDTLPTAPINRLALLRIDADLYESTRDALSALYAKVEPGGLVIVDDYGCIPGCRQAVDEHLARYDPAVELQTIDWTGVYWRKS